MFKSLLRWLALIGSVAVLLLPQAAPVLADPPGGGTTGSNYYLDSATIQIDNPAGIGLKHVTDPVTFRFVTSWYNNANLTHHPNAYLVYSAPTDGCISYAVVYGYNNDKDFIDIINTGNIDEYSLFAGADGWYSRDDPLYLPQKSLRSAVRFELGETFAGQCSLVPKSTSNWDWINDGKYKTPKGNYSTGVYKITQIGNSLIDYYLLDNQLLPATADTGTVFTLDEPSGLYVRDSDPDGCKDTITLSGSTGTYREKLTDKHDPSGCGNSDKRAYPLKVNLGDIANRPDLQGGLSGNDKNSGTDTCTSSGGFGWLVCGLIKLVSDMVQGIGNLIENYLAVPTLNINGTTDNPVRDTWANFRNVANVFFVIIFFVIIFAQLFSLEAYTVKKMLPRLAAAAILVQFSFIISAFMVDVFNVIGAGIGQLITSLSPGTIQPTNFDLGSSGSQTVFGVGIFIAVGIIGKFAGGLISIAGSLIVGTILPFILLALAIFVAVLATLLFRQIFIVLLAIISPLAFLAWVLPNTESLFKRWGSTFIRLLAMYPIIVAGFAGSTAIGAAIAPTLNYKDSNTFISAIVLLIIVLAPLAIIPFSFKFAGGAISAVNGRLEGLRQGGWKRWQGSEARKGIKAKQKADMDKYNEQAASGTKGRLRQAFARPTTLIPGRVGGRKIPLLGAVGDRARSQAYTNLNIKKAEAAKTMESLNNVEALRGVAHARNGRQLRNYISEGLRTGRITQQQAQAMTLAYGSADGAPAQMAALEKLLEFRQARGEDLQAVVQGTHNNIPLAQDIIGNYNRKQAENGNFAESGYVARTNNLRQVTGIDRQDPEVLRMVYTRLNKDSASKVQDWGRATAGAPPTTGDMLEGFLRDPYRQQDVAQHLKSLLNDNKDLSPGAREGITDVLRRSGFTA